MLQEHGKNLWTIGLIEDYNFFPTKQLAISKKPPFPAPVYGLHHAVVIGKATAMLCVHEYVQVRAHHNMPRPWDLLYMYYES